MHNKYITVAVSTVCIFTSFSIVGAAISTFNEGIVIGDTTLTSGLLLDVNGKIGANELCDNTNANCVTTAAVYSAINSSGGSIAGSGTTNYVPKFSTNTSLVSGMMRDTGTMVGVGRTPLVTLDVDGNVAARGGHVYLGSAGNQDIYGDNTSGLYFDSNHSTETQLVLRDADNSIYGRLSGTSNGQYFGLKGPGLSGSYFIRRDNTDSTIRITGSSASDYIDILASAADTLTIQGDLEVDSDVTASDFLYSSDRRLKDNISTIPDSMDVINSLEGVTFDWKKNGRSAVGFIAQDVERVAPTLVETNQEGYKSVRYGNITSYLVEAVKEQQKQIDQQQEQIAQLMDYINQI